jgi:hypothetical protein
MRSFNPSGIIPLGPELDFSALHYRWRLEMAGTDETGEPIITERRADLWLQRSPRGKVS